MKKKTFEKGPGWLKFFFKDYYFTFIFLQFVQFFTLNLSVPTWLGFTKPYQSYGQFTIKIYQIFLKYCFFLKCSNFLVTQYIFDIK